VRIIIYPTAYHSNRIILFKLSQKCLKIGLLQNCIGIKRAYILELNIIFSAVLKRIIKALFADIAIVKSNVSWSGRQSYAMDPGMICLQVFENTWCPIGTPVVDYNP